MNVTLGFLISLENSNLSTHGAGIANNLFSLLVRGCTRFLCSDHSVCDFIFFSHMVFSEHVSLDIIPHRLGPFVDVHINLESECLSVEALRLDLSLPL